MQFTHRLRLEGRNRAARVVFDTGQPEGDCHAGLGQSKLGSGHSLSARGPARRDESALEKPSDGAYRLRVAKSDVTAELVDPDAVWIYPPHPLQESGGVLSVHFPAPIRDIPK
ncbi:MAG TPA: hypothetical protein VFZ95_08665, partial [Steroidobacteraceae bacterium]